MTSNEFIFCVILGVVLLRVMIYLLERHTKKVKKRMIERGKHPVWRPKA